MKKHKDFQIKGSVEGTKIVGAWKRFPPIVVPKWAKWGSVDDDGSIYVYKHKPVWRRISEEWMPAERSYQYFELVGEVRFVGNIKESLVRLHTIKPGARFLVEETTGSVPLIY